MISGSSLKPPRLQKGDMIGVVAPASPMKPERLQKGVRYLENLGYKIRLGESVEQIHGYFAGTDKARASDLNSMFADSAIKAIFCVRGGYGTPRLLPQIDYDLIKKKPKIIVGYSDITALQLAIYAKTSLVSFSGPMVAVEMGKGIETLTENHFWQALTSGEESLGFDGIAADTQVLNGGQAEGRLLGGNLAMLCSLLGTPYSPDLNNAILILEDVGEEPYKIDRYLNQLKNAGELSKISALVLGYFTDSKPTNEPSLTIEQLVAELTSEFNIPIISNFPYGHVDVKYTLPIGALAHLDADIGKLQVIEPVVI